MKFLSLILYAPENKYSVMPSFSNAIFGNELQIRRLIILSRSMDLT